MRGQLKVDTDGTLRGLDTPEKEQVLNQRLKFLMTELGIGSQEGIDRSTEINEQTPPNQGIKEGR